MSKRRDTHNPKLQLMLFVGLLGVGLAIGAASAWGTEVEPFSIEPVAPHASKSLPQTMVDTLDPQGSLLFTYTNGLKMPVCEIFWAKTVAGLDGDSASNKISYRNLKPGALIGVIHFLEDASEDYREDSHDQKLNPGYYTMRYASLSDSDTDDSVLLSPVNLDRSLEPVPFDELVRQSRAASRTKQPAVMSLVPVALIGNEFPDVKTDGQGTWTVQVKIHVKPATSGSARDLALAIVVVTPKQESDGS
jgi:hypothetical protein